MALEWTDDLSVGYGLIDEQHKELFARYNKLIQACKEGSGRDSISSMLDFMVEYVKQHFAEEEWAMKQYNYPDRKEHVLQHEELFEKVNEVYAELKQNGASVSVVTSINHTLLNWLLNHVKKSDARLGRFLATT